MNDNTNTTTLTPSSNGGLQEQPSNYYWRIEHEMAVIAYTEEEDAAVRSKIYSNEIRPALEEMVLAIIRTFKFDQNDVDEYYLRDEVLSAMLGADDGKDKFMYYNPERLNKKGEPTSAYTYLTRIIKNYLIKDSKKIQKKRLITVSINANPEEGDTDIKSDDIAIHEDDTLSESLAEFVRYITPKLDKLFPNKKDYAVAEAIVHLMDEAGRDGLEDYSETSIKYLVRERSRYEEKSFYPIQKKLKQIFKKCMTNYHLEGRMYYDNSYVFTPKNPSITGLFVLEPSGSKYNL